MEENSSAVGRHVLQIGEVTEVSMQAASNFRDQHSKMRRTGYVDGLTLKKFIGNHLQVTSTQHLQTQRPEDRTLHLLGVKWRSPQYEYGCTLVSGLLSFTLRPLYLSYQLDKLLGQPQRPSH
jgi:hypothetical protein